MEEQKLSVEADFYLAIALQKSFDHEQKGTSSVATSKGRGSQLLSGSASDPSKVPSAKEEKKQKAKQKGLFSQMKNIDEDVTPSSLESVDSKGDENPPIVTSNSKTWGSRLHGWARGAFELAQSTVFKPPLQSQEDLLQQSSDSQSQTNIAPSKTHQPQAPAKKGLDPALLEPVTQGQFRDMMQTLTGLLNSKLDKIEKNYAEMQVVFKQEVSKVQSEVVKVQGEVAKVQGEVVKVQAEVVKVQGEQERMNIEIKGVNERLTKVQQDVRSLLVGREQSFPLGCMK
ncbi:hypothetical protein FGO68_gene16959 [Halteria grandinella]|uniref:Uncharacterized protein n=1 Tax=Halteria grandinella TaxID=5974 RepID=A0A8J8T323_HALGN|nr:hypothetical protein FGO68_gene16959 [Halteria grandinella]